MASAVITSPSGAGGSPSAPTGGRFKRFLNYVSDNGVVNHFKDNWGKYAIVTIAAGGVGYGAWRFWPETSTEFEIGDVPYMLAEDPVTGEMKSFTLEEYRDTNNPKIVQRTEIVMVCEEYTRGFKEEVINEERKREGLRPVKLKERVIVVRGSAKEEMEEFSGRVGSNKFLIQLRREGLYPRGADDVSKRGIFWMNDGLNPAPIYTVRDPVDGKEIWVVDDKNYIEFKTIDKFIPDKDRKFATGKEDLNQ